MPFLTISAGLTGTIPSRQRFGIPASRKGLVFTLVSGDGYWGWTPTVTAAGATDAGIPLTVGAPVSLAADNFDFSAAVNIFSAAGAVVNYQEILA
jgi:hypothetical protein